jgi:hypothetical protein
MLSTKRLTLSTFLVACHVSVGCTGAGSDRGSCPFSCPAPSLGLGLAVTGVTDGIAVNGVEATLSGPSAVTLSCESIDDETTCWWPSVPVIAGDYALLVVAPGFEPADLDSKVTVTHDPRCGCETAKIDPSLVTLVPL